MAPSANIGEKISIFEAVHGTAPDITGLNLANPTALLLSGTMMLRHVGLSEKAQGVQGALFEALEAGDRTKDLAQKAGKKSLGTKEFAEAIVKRMPASLKSESIAVNFKYSPPVRPSEQVLHVTPRTIKETTMGMDVFVDSALQPKALATKIQDMLPAHMKLIMISNRGTQVWPTGSAFTECVNHHRCRVEVLEPKTTSEQELLQLSSKFSTVGLRVCSLEMLLKIGDKKGFTLAQGQ